MTIKGPKLNILVLTRKILKILFLAPFETLNWFTNSFLFVLCHATLFLNTAQTAGAVVYQFMIGIDDINIVIEASIGVCDYLGFLYVATLFKAKLDKLEKVFEDIKFFLEFCDSEVITEAVEEVNFYTKVFTTYFCFGLLLNGLVPVLDFRQCNERKLSDFYRKHDPCGMPVHNLYPFDASKPGNYLFVFVVEALNCIFVCFGILAITMTLIGLLIHIIAQIRNCREFILNVFDKCHFTKSEKDRKELRKSLSYCIKYHITIISYTDRVYSIFNLMLITHISLTSMIFAVIGYQIVTVENFTDKLRYALQLGGWIALLYLTCYYGQRIISESTTIADAAYDSLWYNGPIDLQKNVVLLLMRGQRALTLKVASVGSISLETFVGVLKTAYSFFALLITLSE